MNARRVAEESGVRTDIVKEAGRVDGGKAYRALVDVQAEAFLLDTDSGLRIASQPELVGSELEEEALRAALAAAGLIARRASAKRVVFLHVLRASRGYRLHEALSRGGFQLHEVFVRVAYPGSGAGVHDSGTASVLLARAGSLPKGEGVLVVSDTVATGKTLQAALSFLLELAEFKGLKLVEAHIYGFISEAGLRRVAEYLESQGVEKVSFYAVQDLTALSSNNYDMPLYGPDLPSHEAGELRTLGGVASEETLARMLPRYFPGMDQPGDWSERQCVLYNGESYERGRIRDHLERSLKALERLREASRAYPWYGDWLDRVYEERRRALLEALERRAYCRDTA
ncbi:MAG: hypothetical protein QXI76_03495 [Thermofilum sp.]